ncbi:TIMELESS-interacting protein isoform X1 [Procambarus clarkii]|uniref:TIMELESS-interacting protein isoform X1 n=1 Tax=Procambarus clarkii TaxID=6728 RepID=UPI0037426007
MELNVEELFGQREAESDRDSDSGAEDGEESDDGGRNNPMEEAVEVPEPGQETATQQQPIKPKKVVKNPQPKLDIHRLAGPRGIGIIQKSFKNVKFRGKGHEKEDIDVLLKILEHWAHRLFPKLPFRDTLEQIEKLGMKKNVQVLLKRLRLDMFTESELNGVSEETVRRGIDDEEEQQEEPTIDVFDELLGNNGFSAPSQTVLPPSESISHIPSELNKTLTDEQKERLERNKRLAEEKRLARLKIQNEEKARRMASVVEDRETEVESEDIFDNVKKVVNVNEADKPGGASDASSGEDGRDAGIEDMETQESGEDRIIRMTEEETTPQLADTEKGEETAMQLEGTEKEVGEVTPELADNEREEDNAPSSSSRVNPIDSDNNEINSEIPLIDSTGDGIQPKEILGMREVSESINNSAGESLAKENGQRELAEADKDDAGCLFTEDDMLDMLDQEES